MADESESPKKQTATWEGAFAAFAKAFDQIKRNPQPAYLYVGVYLAITLVEVTTLGTTPTGLKDNSQLFAWESLFYFVFLLALPTYALAIADRKQITVGQFMRLNARKFLIVLAAGILYGLIVIGSLLLFIIPAIWTVAWFAFCVLIAVDKNAGPIEALKTSKQLAKNHKAKVWGLIGVSVLLAIGAAVISALPLIGFALSALLSTLVTLLTTGASAILYRWLQTASK